MKWRMMVALMSLSLLAAPATALAGGYGYKGHGYWGHGYRGYGYGGYGHGGYYYGAGIVAGALLLGALLSRPATQRPPRLVYLQPLPRGACVQDQVARTLPDGRIQTGTRTRCY